MEEPQAIKEFQGTYRWLSNFWPCEVELDGITYPTTEHAYQAAKFIDTQTRKKIARASTPGKAKQMVRNLLKTRNFTYTEKIDTMYKLLLQKFSKEPFKTKLLATGNQEIMEGNCWGDTFWGVCCGEGANHLGKLIMDIRKQRQEQEV